MSRKWIIALSMLLTGSAFAALPDPGVVVTRGDTALVLTDPQNDFLSPDGVTWGVVGKCVEKNNTVKNVEALLAAAQSS